jgi:hypothetical protein
MPRHPKKEITTVVKYRMYHTKARVIRAGVMEIDYFGHTIDEEHYLKNSERYQDHDKIYKETTTIVRERIK